MAKKKQEVFVEPEAVETAEVAEQVNRTRLAIEEAGREPSLKAIAITLNVPPQRIYSVAKQPKAGEIYDARVYNWDAIDRFITRRLDPDVLPTHADVVTKALELDEEFQKNDGRKKPRGTSKAGILLNNGNLMPARKYELAVGDQVMIRKEAAPRVYTIVMITDTHVVFQLEDTPELTCYSNWTVNQQMIPPTRVEETKQQRLEAIKDVEAEQGVEGEEPVDYPEDAFYGEDAAN